MHGCCKHAEEHINTDSTGGQQADGHEQHVFLLMQVEFFQTDLELHQWLQQLQSVTRCGGRHRHTVSAAESTLREGHMYFAYISMNKNDRYFSTYFSYY